MKKRVYKSIFEIFLVVLGCFIIAFAYNLFNAKSGVLIGGLSGICIIAMDFINGYLGTNLSFVVLYLLLNVVLICISLKLLGKKFALYTILGIACYTGFVEICTFAQNIQIPSDDLFLCSVFSGILIGFGVGLTIRYGGSTGGSEIIACMINKKNSKIGIGAINFMINACVVILAAITSGFTLALYGLICIYLSGVMTDFVIQGSQGVNAYYIVSRKNHEIVAELTAKLDLSVTAFHSTALTTNEEIDVLCCVVRGHEIHALKSIIYEIDKNAFVFATKINEAMNKGFSKLEDGSTIVEKLLRKNNSKKSRVASKTLENAKDENIEIAKNVIEEKTKKAEKSKAEKSNLKQKKD